MPQGLFVSTSLVSHRWLLGRLHNQNLSNTPRFVTKEFALLADWECRRSYLCVSSGVSLVRLHKRIDDWQNVPNSGFNNNGQPILNDSNADNDNHARVSVRYTKVFIAHSYANHQSGDELQLAWLGALIHWFRWLTLTLEWLVVWEQLTLLCYQPWSDTLLS